MSEALPDRTLEVCVVGAGAAGLWAAAQAAQGCRDVWLLEKTLRIGSKILASGGTRCNLTTTLGPRDAAALFGKQAARFLAPAFAALPPAKVREHFHRLGVPTITEPELEKVFPRSQRARDVRDALLVDARNRGVRVVSDCPVRAVRPVSDGFELQLPGRALRCRRVLLCPGGKSYPKTGTTGDGYSWLSQLGLKLLPRVPALVPLTSAAGWVRALSGIALQACEARLLDASGRELGRRRRPLLFTHHGLSGPAAMDLSVHVARGAGQRFELAVDMFPETTAESLSTALIGAAGRRGGGKLSQVLELLAPEPLPRRLVAALAQQAGLPGPQAELSQLRRDTRKRLLGQLKGLRVQVEGTLGFRKAEVTAGGLALQEVERKTMECKKYPGLYVFGEILDLAGPIGGLNFQAAFATGHLAGLAAGRR